MTVREPHNTAAGWWAGACVVLLVAGCGKINRDYMADISSGQAEVATAAMNQAVAKKNQRAIVPLIKRLYDEDPAIRMCAIGSLKDMTGQDLGYRSYESAVKRTEAIQRWWAWARQHNLATEQEETALEQPGPTAEGNRPMQ